MIIQKKDMILGATILTSFIKDFLESHMSSNYVSVNNQRLNEPAIDLFYRCPAMFCFVLGVLFVCLFSSQ